MIGTAAVIPTRQTIVLTLRVGQILWVTRVLGTKQIQVQDVPTGGMPVRTAATARIHRQAIPQAIPQPALQRAQSQTALQRAQARAMRQTIVLTLWVGQILRVTRVLGTKHI